MAKLHGHFRGGETLSHSGFLVSALQVAYIWAFLRGDVESQIPAFHAFSLSELAEEESNETVDGMVLWLVREQIYLKSFEALQNLSINSFSYADLANSNLLRKQFSK